LEQHTPWLIFSEGTGSETAQRRNGTTVDRITTFLEMVLPLSHYAIEPLRPSILYENKGLR
jgi:hypothetical protein